MSTERSLWEMLTSLLHRVKTERAERKKMYEPSREKIKHLLSVPYSQTYQPFIDQIMNHDPYGVPLLQKGRVVRVEPQCSGDHPCLECRMGGFGDARKQAVQTATAHPTEDGAPPLHQADRQP